MALTIDLKGKVVLISGVSSGIGLGVARMMARAGAYVTGCALDAPNAMAAKGFVGAMEQEGAEAMYTQLDVCDTESLDAWVTEVIERWGRIDVLVSNAGSNVFEGAAECDDAAWQHNMQLNLTSHWQLSKRCRPWLAKSGQGLIIIMGSNHANATIPGCFPYNVTKTALTGLVRSLAIEWGPDIRVLGLAPGFIDTPGNKKWFDSFSDPVAARAQSIALHPVKRLGTVTELGAWCVFLASEYAAFATGTTYLIDGGRSALMQDPAKDQ